jgi:hypothetical protein
MKATVLVVTNRTAASDDLLAALRARATRSPARFEFVMPPERATPEAEAEAGERLQEALGLAHEAGLEAVGRVGSPDPLTAVLDAYDPRRHDEILISTLPASTSQWLRIDLPSRVSRATGALVSHVAVRERRPAAR